MQRRLEGLEHLLVSGNNCTVQEGSGDAVMLPTPDEQKDAMVHLDNTCPMKEGETWCLVYYRWMEAFKSYTGV